MGRAKKKKKHVSHFTKKLNQGLDFPCFNAPHNFLSRLGIYTDNRKNFNTKLSDEKNKKKYSRTGYITGSLALSKLFDN